MSWKRIPPPEGYVSVVDIQKACKDSGLDVSRSSIKYRIDNGKVSSVRDLNHRKRRRLVSIEELPGIIAHFSELYESRDGKYYSLQKLASDLGMAKRSLHSHERAKKLGIETFEIGGKTMMTKREYFKWRFLLDWKKNKDKKYLSTGELAGYFGVSYKDIWYNIKMKRIPAERDGHYHRILIEDFIENREEWKEICGFQEKEGNGEKV